MMWASILFGGLKSLAQRVLGFVASYPWQAALMCALALAGWFYMGKRDALADVAARNVQIAAMERASKEATAAQIAMNKAIVDKQTDIARKADANETDIIDRGRDYADRMPAKDYCRKADSAAESGLASSDNSAGNSAVILERQDYDILVGNTARLVKVKAWGDALVAEGLAVPVE